MTRATVAVEWRRILAGDPMERRRVRRRRISDLVWRTVSVTLILAGLTSTIGPFILQAVDMHAQDRASVSVDQSTRSLENPSAAGRYEQAEEYNRRLADNPIPVGEVVDPFGHTGDFSGSDDPDYVNTLDAGDGVMATISIPSISVRLPIRHGSSQSVLADGAGHVHGTSLPVGGPGTHAVITAHRGMPGKLMFTRVDELKPGDPIYLHVMGRTLAYRVTGSQTVQPDDVSGLRIRPGVDMITLLTCTPYGVNTQRLLVHAVRAPDAPPPAAAPGDTRLTALLWAAGTGGGMLAVGVIVVRSCRRDSDRCAHRGGA